MKIHERTSLKTFTTFNIGGQARYFVKVKSLRELKVALAFAEHKKQAVFILGGGSNVLISDKGFDGLVIKIEIMGIEQQENVVISGAGESWDGLVAYSVKYELYGLENLSLIPGTVGAAPVQNIGAYGAEVKDTLLWVEVYDTEKQIIKTFSNKECEFEYRNSIFKRKENKKYIITRVAFALSKEKKLNTQYKDIVEYIKNKLNNVEEKNLTLKNISDAVIAIRTAKLPDVKKIGTAGSFFKNPVIEKNHYQQLVKEYPLLPSFSTVSPEYVKVSAAWILDTICGFKGYTEGNVGVYKNQALVLVNNGNATAAEINALAEKMISCVKEKTNIVLEKEVQII